MNADSGSRRRLHGVMRPVDVKSGALGGGFAHALAVEGEPVRVVHEPVEDGVGDGRIGDRLVPVIDRQLAGHDGRAAVVPIVDDLEEVAALLRGQVASPQSSRISSSTRARLLRSRAWRPSPRASASASNSLGTR